MKKLLMLVTVIQLVFADQSVYLSSDQLNIAKNQAVTDVNTTKALMPSIIESINISQSKIDNQKSIIDMAVVQAKGQAAPISTSYESGEKYYIFSDQVKQDAIQQATEYSKASPLNANDTITYYNQMKSNAKDAIGEGRVLIFISMSMPKNTIQNLISQGEKIGAVFVLRGLVNGSLKQTQKQFYALMNDHHVGAMINPELFKTFNVTQVPTFAIYAHATQNPLNTGCKIAPDFVTVTGAVSLRYALDDMRHSKLSGLASNYLDLMDSSSFYKK